MEIAVVILNWNGKALLEHFLPSVIANSHEADIYVVDNASTDDSVKFIKNHFPSVNIIRNKKNSGFAKGYNDALKQINADIFCLLNNDVEVSEGWLNPIISLFRSNSKTVVIQPKILNYHKKDYFEYAGAAGGFIDKYGYPYCRGRIFNTIEKDLGQYNDTSPIFWASGACFFIRSATFKSLGGFDESFFAHMEEIDLCWRIQNSGHDITYCSSSVVYHVGGATLNNLDPKKTFLNFRNSLYALAKNAKGTLICLIFPRLLLDGMAGLKFLLELKPKHTFAIIKAHFTFYVRLKQLMRQRRNSHTQIKYYKRPSIVIDYFIKRKKYYKSL
ncbi:glycosyltransferase family 2 protein [Aestuariivivens sediminis]|uniref:glycosyltransferase family 2 protein n=1 Tax=Aestuariivivens sediminis TaxID=2913557 RepID=UPI001F55ACA5|nr:glycosyltransferase family 2 protein [Aestuariivivens sediminis]